MAKNKQKKKKERERRVAQQKLAAATQKRTQEKAAQAGAKSVSRVEKLVKSAVGPKVDYVPDAKKNPFNQRRSGGG